MTLVVDATSTSHPILAPTRAPAANPDPVGRLYDNTWVRVRQGRHVVRLLCVRTCQPDIVPLVVPHFQGSGTRPRGKRIRSATRSTHLIVTEQRVRFRGECSRFGTLVWHGSGWSGHALPHATQTLNPFRYGMQTHGSQGRPTLAMNSYDAHLCKRTLEVLMLLF